MVQSLAPGLPRGNDQVPSTRARPEPLFTPRRTRISRGTRRSHIADEAVVRAAVAVKETH